MDVLGTLTNNRFLSKHSVKLVWLIAILFLLAVIASISWNAWSQSKTKQANYQPQELAPITQSTRPNYRVSDIIGANLFGNPTPVAVVTVAPKTTLDLTLEGVLWSSDNNAGRAIIMVGKKAAGLYSVGEEIKGASAKIEEIRDGEVILNRNGVMESLPLIKQVASGNREIITFSNDSAPDMDAVSDRSNVQEQARQDQEEQPEVNIPTQNNNERRVRRPNFSGLDRALEKMGDL